MRKLEHQERDKKTRSVGPDFTHPNNAEHNFQEHRKRSQLFGLLISQSSLKSLQAHAESSLGITR